MRVQKNIALMLQQSLAYCNRMQPTQICEDRWPKFSYKSCQNAGAIL